MSIEYLTHAEDCYFMHDSDYRNVVKEWCRELGKTLHRPYYGDSAVGVSAHMQTQSILKGSAKGRSERRSQAQRFKSWRRRRFSKELAEKKRMDGETN